MTTYHEAALFDPKPGRDYTPEGTRDGSPTHAHTGPDCHFCAVAAGWQDTAESLARRDEGMARALSPDHLAEWKDEFRATVMGMPAGARFTSEAVISAIGLPNGEIAKDANNAVGAMMNGLARRGFIRKTSERKPSRRPSSHGAELAVWEVVA